MDIQRRDVKEFIVSLNRMSSSMDRMADAMLAATARMEELAEILREVPEDPEED